MAVRTESLSLLQARRIALGAQGFTARRSSAPGRAAITATMSRIGLLQVDSVNVLSRSHYLPLLSRLGPYPRDVLDRASNRRPRLLVEYWAHEAALLPVTMHPLLRFRMAAARQEAWGGIVRVATERPELVAHVRQEVAARGPLTSAQIEDASVRGPRRWGWNWSDAKRAMEFLFWSGEVVSAGRDAAFVRRYDLPERVLPAEVLAAPTPEPAAAHRALVAFAARAHGIGTEACLRDYFRLRPAASKQAVAELVEDGELVPVQVRGWGRPVYRHRDAQLPRTVRARALLSPFDSLIWTRPRVEALFGFRYRLEIYTPAARRVHGYYVLPFLLGDRLVARVDLKADRAARLLRVQAAWAEPEAPVHTAAELAAELRILAGWLDLDDIVVSGAGDLAAHLQRAL